MNLECDKCGYEAPEVRTAERGYSHIELCSDCWSDVKLWADDKKEMQPVTRTNARVIDDDG